MRLYQINHEDLAALEVLLPDICTTPAVAANDNLTKRRWRAVQQIILRVRWGYAPFDAAEVVGDDDLPQKAEGDSDD